MGTGAEGLGPFLRRSPESWGMVRRTAQGLTHLHRAPETDTPALTRVLGRRRRGEGHCA